MASQVPPYVLAQPGDLVTAENWNAMQSAIKNDIRLQIEKALGQVEEVLHADDADKLDGKTLEDITKEIIKQTLQAIAKTSGGYETVFLRLEPGEERIIEHGLHNFPLTDIYQLEYFPAVCATGEREPAEEVRFVTFYLYNSNEARTMRRRTGRGKTAVIEIEEAEGHHHARLKLAELLQLYDVQYTETTDLEELVANFWDAFLQRQTTDDFDPLQYGQSPWFEKCCGDRRSVKELKERADWDRLYLKMLPKKTVNALHREVRTPAERAKRDVIESHLHAAPNHVQIVQYDFDTLGIRLLEKPTHPREYLEGVKVDNTVICPPLPKEFLEDLKVLVLLKV